jgi:Acyl-CoA thioesterase C-terminal domain/Acyl-CoA thioesterase N-terminal domain
MTTPEAVFVPDHDGFVATPLARGPWDPGAQHGGAPSALLARAIEHHEPDPAMRVARLTIELLRPVPIGRVDVRTRTLRPGRKVQLVEAAIDAGGTEVARAVGLRIRERPLDLPGSGPDERLEPGPEGEKFQVERVTPGFGSAMEIVVSDGGIDQVGRAAVWFRLRIPLVAGEEVSPLSRVAAAADFGNGISAVVDWDAGWLFINPDLTLTLSRHPRGEWVALDARTYASGEGIGFAESALYDQHGRIGRSVQSLLFDRQEG